MSSTVSFIPSSLIHKQGSPLIMPLPMNQMKSCESTPKATPSNSFIRLSPTSFFKAQQPQPTAPSKSSSELLSLLMSSANAQKEGSTSTSGAKSKEGSAVVATTPKSHHRKGGQVGVRPPGGTSTPSSAANARKKLCYPEDGSPSQRPTKGGLPGRSVCFIPKFVQQQTGVGVAAENINNNDFSANVYATPPRHSLRRQQSASATMVSVGNGRYRSNTAFVRFTPPIGEDISALFAGSKFSDSPSAKSLPMPPSHWLEEIDAHTASLSKASSKEEAQAGSSSSSSDEESLSKQKKQRETKKKALKKLAEEEEEPSSSDTGVVFDLDDGKCSSPSSESSQGMGGGATTEEEIILHLSASQKPMPKTLAKMLKPSASAGQVEQMKGREGVRIHPLQLIAAVAAS